MRKLAMTILPYIPLVLIISTLISCSDSNLSKENQSTTLVHSKVYPKKPYHAITFYWLDTPNQIKDDHLGNPRTNSDSLLYISRPGFIFIDSNGKTTTKRFHSIDLTPNQIVQLERFLTDAPCDGKTADKACEPIFTNVYVFYDQDKKVIAQLHLSFQCEMSYFLPAEDYMCNFDNQVDFKKLEDFTESIKFQK